jgi:flavin-dependent dehydrogenase
MASCDVLIVGGGPAGAACAWKLVAAGFDVTVVDRAAFPRDKVCGGWITPQVVADLCLDLGAYARTRTLQPITGFRTGIIGGDGEIETTYGATVSFGIRRCEFDDYLLRRSQARLLVGSPVTSIRHDGRRWIVNDAVAAPMLVGAGGHFCPVARQLNEDRARPDKGAPLVVAQEVEFGLDPRSAAAFTTRPDTPELYFCPDLQGYGWCFRKQTYMNIGLGRADRSGLPAATAAFIEFLERRGKIPHRASWHWRGHAYLLQDSERRRVVDDGVMLIGDAAGLAYPQSGEGIRPAVESGLLAAETIVQAGGRYDRDRLLTYDRRLRAEFGGSSRRVWRFLPAGLQTALAARLLHAPRFVRHVALDRWFLHAGRPPLAA